MDLFLTIRVALLSLSGLGLLTAGGCVSQPPAEPAAYVVNGKAVIQSSQASQRLNFRWQQSRGEYRISVWGALGMGRMRLSGTEQAVLVTGGGRDTMSGPAAQMMEEHLGWSAPLEAMGSWLVGEPASTLAQDLVVRDEQNRVTGLRQEGWHIEFSQYQLVDDQWRPKRLDITGAQISIRLILSLPRPVMGS